MNLEPLLRKGGKNTLKIKNRYKSYRLLCFFRIESDQKSAFLIKKPVPLRNSRDRSKDRSRQFLQKSFNNYFCDLIY